MLVLTGTRSRKRGIDSDGACANYVETEQVSSAYHGHKEKAKHHSVLTSYLHFKKFGAFHDLCALPLHIIFHITKS